MDVAPGGSGGIPSPLGTPRTVDRTSDANEAAASETVAKPEDVAGAGFAVGYDSPSQFSREYRRMFGVPPSRDAAAVREVTVLANSP